MLQHIQGTVKALLPFTPVFIAQKGQLDGTSGGQQLSDADADTADRFFPTLVCTEQLHCCVKDLFGDIRGRGQLVLTGKAQ